MIIDKQLDDLKSSGYPGAIESRRPDGSVLITVPDIPLQGGWSKNSTSVRFFAPVGYPHAQPDCFWADSDLRLVSGAMPQATNISPIPGDGSASLWFSWHVSRWSPNRDSLLTYLKVIQNRLRECR